MFVLDRARAKPIFNSFRSMSVEDEGVNCRGPWLLASWDVEPVPSTLNRDCHGRVSWCLVAVWCDVVWWGPHSLTRVVSTFSSYSLRTTLFAGSDPGVLIPT